METAPTCDSMTRTFFSTASISHSPRRDYFTNAFFFPGDVGVFACSP